MGSTLRTWPGITSANLETMMTKPETLFEKASHDLNQFRERRLADRRAVARDTPDRRRQPGDLPEIDDSQKDAGQQTS
jgi:hypothetical protein